MKKSNENVNPFKDYAPEKADQIFAHAESICVDEVDAAAHFAACLMSIVRDPDVAHQMLDYVNHIAHQVEE